MPTTSAISSSTISSPTPKIAFVHDYLDEFGGAERVLLALSEIWPDAPIYTAYYQKNSPAWARFKDRDIRVSFAHYLPFFASRLHSPLRFMAPMIWNSFDFAEYDVIIGSASWYITKGFAGKRPGAIEVCYCHTPPRWLYGYQTSVEWQKHWLVRVYAAVVGHFMRVYDVMAAQKVDIFVANSQNVQKRIEKFYRRTATVIYPPVDELDWKVVKNRNQDGYYLVISRIVGGKGLDLAVQAALQLGLHLKIAGRPAGYSTQYRQIEDQIARASAGGDKKTATNASGDKKTAKIELLGFVPDEKLVQLYAGAKGFLALASDEDFGITPVESMMAGTPVIAYRGGGYLETVIEDKTGIFFDELSVSGLVKAINAFEKKIDQFDPKLIHQHALKFSKKRFQKEVIELVRGLASTPKN